MSRYPEMTPALRVGSEGPYAGDDFANQLYQHYFSRLMGVTTTRYRWLGLGAWIDPMRVEWLLVTQGLCAFTFTNQSHGAPNGHDNNGVLFRDGGFEAHGSGQHLEVYDGRFTVRQAFTTGYLDDTFTPSGYRTITPNGFDGISFNTNLPLEEWKGVPIWGDANRSRYDLETIIMFARRLANASLVVDTNLRMTMRGAMVATSNDKLKTKQIALDGAMRGVDVFVTDAELIGELKALDMGVHPDAVEKSHIVAMRLWSEALEALGIESPAAEKSERHIVAELGAEQSQVAAIRRLTLTPRRHAASLINRRYFGGAEVVEVVDQWQ